MIFTYQNIKENLFGTIASTGVAYGSTDRLLVPTRSGYVFDGWFDAATGGNRITDSEGKPSGTAEGFVSEGIWTLSENRTVYAAWTKEDSGSSSPIYGPSALASEPSTPDIPIINVSSCLFGDVSGSMRATPKNDSEFPRSIEIKVTDTDENASAFGLSIGSTVYSIDISLYIKETGMKTKAEERFSATIYLLVPPDLLEVREKISVLHKSDYGTVTRLDSRLMLIDDVWYQVFEATEFSPYALVVENMSYYNEADGIPYYLGGDGEMIFIGLAANGRFIAPPAKTIYYPENSKSFSDTAGHWAYDALDFVTSRELFVGTVGNAFSPDTGMTRAMFATVIGRLYERSFGEITAAISRVMFVCLGECIEIFGRSVFAIKSRNQPVMESGCIGFPSY